MSERDLETSLESNVQEVLGPFKNWMKRVKCWVLSSWEVSVMWKQVCRARLRGHYCVEGVKNVPVGGGKLKSIRMRMQ